MRLLGYALALVLGLVAGVAAVAVHRTVPGLALGVASALAALWALWQWRERLAGWFAVGWLGALVVALAGRPEGDYVIGSDPLGYCLIGAGLAVLVAGVLALAVRDSGTRGDPT